MSKINLISAKHLIGEFLFDFDVKGGNFMSSLNRHIVRGIELMNIDTYFKRCSKEFKVENGRIPVPCLAKYIELVVVDLGGIHVLDLSNNNLALTSKLPSDITVYGDAYADDNLITMNNNYTGNALVIYRTIPFDKEGYALIPDNAEVKEALPYFIIAKMALSGYKHKVISREEAEQKWAVLHPRARNSVNFPTVHEMQSFTEMWNNPLLGDLYNNLFSS